MKNTSDTNRILSVADRFSIDGRACEAAAFGNGLINDTFLVTTDEGERYVLQRINTDVFRNPEALQRNLKKISAHISRCLAEEGVSDAARRVLVPVDPRDGSLTVEDEGCVWRMTRFIAGSHSCESVTPRMAELTGHAFAQFHRYFAYPDAPQLEETIPDFHNISFRLRQLREAVEEDKAGRLAEVRELVDALLSRADEMLEAERSHAAGRLPRRVAHCDTKVNNVLFDEEENVLCVIDLDTTMPGFVLSDFGDFIRTAANTGAEDDRDLSRVGVDMEIFGAFARGYVGAADFLTPEERRLLPFGARLLTYMQAVRFLTDYLNGDTYYKVAYPEHNRVRTRAQMRLLESIDSRYEEMNNLINSIR